MCGVAGIVYVGDKEWVGDNECGVRVCGVLVIRSML